MSKSSKKLRNQLDQGASVNEQTGEAMLAPIDVAHSRKQYVGFRDTELGYATRREPRINPARDAVSSDLSEPQYQHGLIWQQRGGGQRDYPDGGRLGVKAVHRHDYGLGPAVARPTDLGADPIDTPVAHDYRRAPEGPGLDVLSKYVDARRHLPELTEGNGYPNLPRYHQLSPQVTMGDELYAPFEGRQ